MTTGNIVLADTLSVENGVEIRSLKTKYWNGYDDPSSKSNYNPWFCTFTETRPDLIKDTDGSWYGSPVYPGSWVNPVAELSIITLMNDVQSSTKSGINSLVSLAESRETVAALAEKIESFTKFVLTAKRGGFGRALSNYKKSLGATPAKELSNRWLEMHFGWLPLLQEISTIIEGLNSASPIPVPDMIVDCKQKYRAGETRGGFGSFYFGNRIKRRSSYRVAVNYGHKDFSFSEYLGVPQFPFELYNAIHDGDLVGVYKAFKYHFESFGIQVTEAAWNVSPFSFVVDWFLPVGDYLSALRTFKEYDFKRIQVTEKHTQEVTSFLAPFGALMGCELIPGYDKKTTYIRRQLTDLTLSRPRFNFEYKSLTHCIHSAALINGLLPSPRGHSH